MNIVNFTLKPLQWLTEVEGLSVHVHVHVDRTEPCSLTRLYMYIPRVLNPIHPKSRNRVLKYDAWYSNLHIQCTCKLVGVVLAHRGAIGCIVLCIYGLNNYCVS